MEEWICGGKSGRQRKEQVGKERGSQEQKKKEREKQTRKHRNNSDDEQRRGGRAERERKRHRSCAVACWPSRAVGAQGRHGYRASETADSISAKVCSCLSCLVVARRRPHVSSPPSSSSSLLPPFRALQHFHIHVYRQRCVGVRGESERRRRRGERCGAGWAPSS